MTGASQKWGEFFCSPETGIPQMGYRQTPALGVPQIWDAPKMTGLYAIKRRAGHPFRPTRLLTEAIESQPPVDILAVAHADHKHTHFCLVYLIDDPIIPHPDTIAALHSLQGTRALGKGVCG